MHEIIINISWNKEEEREREREREEEDNQKRKRRQHCKHRKWKVLEIVHEIRVNNKTK